MYTCILLPICDLLDSLSLSLRNHPSLQHMCNNKKGLDAKDLFHVKQDLDMHLSDKACQKPTREMMTKNIGKNKKVFKRKAKRVVAHGLGLGFGFL
jgi:hypothetical protein